LFGQCIHPWSINRKAGKEIVSALAANLASCRFRFLPLIKNVRKEEYLSPNSKLPFGRRYRVMLGD